LSGRPSIYLFKFISPSGIIHLIEFSLDKRMNKMLRKRNKASGIAVACETAGNQARVAEALGVTQQAVGKWMKQGWAPLARAIQMEQLYGVQRFTTMYPKLAVMAGAKQR
jgi:hypothetical protein